MKSSIHGVAIPDTKLTRAVTEFVRDTESELLFNHSSRVFYLTALAGLARGLQADAELLYAGAIFHGVGLLPSHSGQDERLEVDGANAAKAFLRSHGIVQADIDTVWTAIALHATPGIPPTYAAGRRSAHRWGGDGRARVGLRRLRR